MRQKAEILFSLAVLAIFAFAVYEARSWPLYARLLPWTIGFPMLALCLVQLVLGLRRQGARTAEARGIEIPPSVIQQRTLTILAWIVGFSVAIWLFGFPLAVPLFMFFYLKIESGENWWCASLLSALGWGLLVGLFDWALNLPFPEGELFIWLGLS